MAGKIKIGVQFQLSLWQAIKLRIAGKNYKPVTDAILKRMSQVWQAQDAKHLKQKHYA